jgi:hypothetical protein
LPYCTAHVGTVVAVYESPGIVIVPDKVPPPDTLSDTPPANVKPTLVELPMICAHEVVQFVVIAR